MATLQIKMKNQKHDKKFISHNGIKIRKFSDKYVMGNGWECQIKEDETLICTAKKVYDEVEHVITYTVLKGGEMTLTLKIGDKPPLFLKNGKIAKWPQDGILILPDGYIDKIRPYFRYMKFQKLLETHGLTAVCNQSANGIYELKKEFKGNKIISGEEIKTDGKTEVIFSEKKSNAESDSISFSIISKVKVTGATWVIKKRFITGVVSHRFLYTTYNIRYLEGLPKIKD